MHELENGHNQKRNIERDSQFFSWAIKNVEITELPTTFEGACDVALKESIAATNIFVIGEIHGVTENVDIIYTLFKKFDFRQLALEWNMNLQKVVADFLVTGEIDFNSIADSPDGRITPGHFALLQKLTRERMLDKVVLFDTSGPGDASSRDQKMASNIMANLSDVPMLVIAGSVHTKTKPRKFDDEPDEFHPMGELVKAQLPTAPFGEIEYLSGEYYNFGVEEFFSTAEKSIDTSARFYRQAGGTYIFELPEATAAMVPDMHTRLSRQNKK